MLQDLSLQCLVNTSHYEQTAPQLMRCIAMPNIRSVNLVLAKRIADNDTFIDWLSNLENPSLLTVTAQIHGDWDGTSQERIVNAFHGTDGGIFRVEASTDRIFGTRTLKISFA